MSGVTLLTTEQLPTKDLSRSVRLLDDILERCDIHEIACEDYRVYSWESEKHKWAGLHTPKLIGVVVALATLHRIPVKMRMAITAKQFVTDEKLGEWGLWQKGKRHGRDAIRHAVYHQLFGPEAG
jgi:hypothetical protein